MTKTEELFKETYNRLPAEAMTSYNGKDMVKFANIVSDHNNISPETLKTICCAFFRWWYNAPGNNTEQGFDTWWETNKGL